MKPIFQEIFRYGMDDLLNPDRFREVLVIVLTGLGDHPAEIAQMLGAWLAAVLISKKIFPGKN